MSIFDAMQPRNGAAVSQLISNDSDVNARTASGLTVIQHAALEYFKQIDHAGSLIAAQQLRQEWAATIGPLVATNRLVAKKVTSEAYNSEYLSDLPTGPEVAVDAMLHDLGYFKSELAVERGYAEGLSSDRAEGEG